MPTTAGVLLSDQPTTGSTSAGAVTIGAIMPRTTGSGIAGGMATDLIGHRRDAGGRRGRPADQDAVEL